MCLNPLYIEKKGVTFSCGKCEQCHTKYVQHWVFRLQQEQKLTHKSLFLTLTYDYQNIPMYKGKFTLDKSDYQNFLKRLRKQLPDTRIKYVCAGEYGGEKNRPHYHLLLFGVDLEDFNTINQAWGKGLIHVGSVEPASIAYTFKYSIKGDKKKRDWRQTKQFIAMSKGLGETFAFDITYEKTVHVYEKYVDSTKTNGKTDWIKIRNKDWTSETEIKVLTRIKKIRIPKVQFAKKLEQLLLMPYYKIPSQKGGSVKMSVPRFYLRAADYDTTQLTELYLDKMATKYQDITMSRLPKLLEKESIQRIESINTQVDKVNYSISKEKI